MEGFENISIYYQKYLSEDMEMKIKTVNFSKNGWLIKHKKYELLCLGIFYQKISSFILS